MIKMISSLRRQSGLTHAAFANHWRDIHGPLIVAHAQDLGIVKYIQSHADGAENALTCDGIAEVWFESREAQRRRRDDPAFRSALQAIRADEDRFIDRAATRVWWGREVTVLPLASC